MVSPVLRWENEVGAILVTVVFDATFRTMDMLLLIEIVSGLVDVTLPLAVAKASAWELEPLP